MQASRISTSRALISPASVAPRPVLRLRNARIVPSAVDTKEGGTKPEQSKDLNAKETTEKYGLEAGLYKVMTDKPVEGSEPVSKTQQAKDLLTQYGSAYLITSISFAIVSFGLCYFAVDHGVDIAAVLGKIGIETSDKSETVGTVAIAYAAHKALSPVRFPPTVALTPIVAKMMGKKKEEGGEKKE